MFSAVARKLVNRCGPVVCILLACFLGAPARADVEEVLGVVIKVADMHLALKFYTEILPFQVEDDRTVEGAELAALEGLPGARQRVVRLRLGGEHIELAQFLNTDGRPVQADSRSNDRWFQHIAIVVGDMDRAYAVIRARDVEHVSAMPQRLPDWNTAAGGIKAFYFRDQDGHNLELISYPPGKGDPKWQRADGNLFLGIDHTAIVVSDTARSADFYRRTLGMRIAGESENYGMEQEALNSVPGAHLKITGLRGRSGPGIEFLEYLSPRDGRPRPEPRADDLVDTETAVRVGDIGRYRDEVSFAPGGGPRVADGTGLGFHRGFVVRDPDGHAVRIVE